MTKINNNLKNFGGAEAGPTERYNSFTIKFNLIKIVITPTRRINLNIHNRMIMEYRIEKFLDSLYLDSSGQLKKKEEYVSLGSDYIYFYFSIGETNGLQSNLWLPMLYFNTRNSVGEKSLRKDFGLNGVIKNSVFQCLNFSELNKIIYDKTQSDISSLNFSEDQLKSRFSDQYNGLPGVLNRIENLFDLFIATNGSRIRDYDSSSFEHIKSLRPREVPLGYTTYNDDILYYDDFYRQNIITALKHIRIELESILDIEYQIIEVPKVQMTAQQFNDSLNLFSVDNNISESYKKKNNFYAEISNDLYDFVKSSVSKGSLLDSILLEKDAVTFFYNKGSIVGLIRNGWKIDVKKKYLKYKKKYLELKHKNNKN